MRILLTQGSVWVPTFGGANKSNRLLLEDLARRGHVCRAVVPATGHQGPSSREELLAELDRSGFLARPELDKVVFDVNGVEVHAMSSTADLLDRLGREISEFDPDRVLVSSEDPAQLLLEAAVRASERAIYVCHTTLALPFGPQGYAQNPAKAELVQRTAGVVTVSHYLGRYIRRWGGLEAEVLPLLDYGRGPFPNFGNFDQGAVTMINPCAIKGIDIFLELARRFPELEFAAVPTWGTTQQDRAALEALPNVSLLAARDDIDEIFARTRVLLVPSLWAEALGRVALEAMLRGIPVLAADVGGLPEAMLGLDYLLPVQPVETYLGNFDDRLLPIPVVPRQDYEPWCQALGRLTSRRELYESLSARARRAALSYVEGWSAEPLERYLEDLRQRRPVTPRANQTPDRAEAIQSRLAGLSPEKRALLLRRLRGKAKAGGPTRSPKSASRPTILQSQRRGASESDTVLFPLSFAQRRLWFIDRLEAGHTAYNEAFALTLRGPLQDDALAAAVATLERRHELLRTRFVVRDDEPWQQVEPWRRRHLPCVALDALAPDARRSEYLRLAARHHRQPYDLNRGPLFRIVLVRLDAGEHVLLLGGHHVVADGWSMRILLGELGTLYSAAVESRRADLPALPIQYADYADWEQKWLASDRMRAEIAFWKKRLAGAPAVLELPSDRPRAAQLSHRGAGLPLRFPPAATAGLGQLARSHNATFFMVGLAGFMAVIHRLTGQSDLVVGVPLAGRRLPELEHIVGFLVNMLALRVVVAPQGSASDLIGAVRDAAIEAYEHQDVPFEKLVEELRPERAMSHTPIFQQAFNLFQSPDASPIALAGLETEASPIDTVAAKFDLELYLEESRTGKMLSGELIFATDLFDPTTVRRFGNLFQRWLAEAVEHPDQQLGDFAMLDPGERHQLCVEINDTGRRRPADEATLWDLVVAQAGRTPGATAVVGGLRRLSYVDLIGRAEELAGRLRALGVGPEVPVGLLVGRSPEMVVAMLGVLAAGGAYVPLDPSYPRQRLAFMLTDALSGQATPVVVTEPELRDRLPPLDLQVTRVDVPRTVPTGDRVEPAKDGCPRPENLAYIMYTSGSTGRPKGVAVPHRGAVELVRWAIEAFDPEVLGGVLAATSISFDLSVYELFVPLSMGGRVVLAANALELPSLAAAEEVTLLHTVPSAMATLVEGRLPSSVRFVQLGGEPLPPGLAQTIYERHPQVSRVWNYYGPTEDTVWSTIRRMSRTAEPVTIGRALANTRVHLVDESFHAVPIGRPGELLLAGDGQARGYHSRPGLTAQRFVPDPFATGGSRVYRTGDLARFLGDGELDILGRIDHQVKIRGFRIELEEIRAVLLAHPSVHEALVVAQELSAASGSVLIAYVALASGSADVDELRRHLAGQLPEYMMPSFIEILERLPLLPNGKVNRAALPRPESLDGGPSGPPRTPHEEIVAGLFAEILGRERVGREDDFFALGGHSLLATRLVSRVRDALSVELSLRAVFEAPSVAALARQLTSGRTGVLPPLQAAGETPPFEAPLSLVQQRLWLLYQIAPESSAYHIPLAARLRGELSIPALEASLGEIVGRHQTLRTTFRSAQGQPLQQIAAYDRPRLPWIDLTSLDVSQGETWLAKELTRLSRAPFDLAQSPPLRAALLRRAPDDHVLLIVMHHLVSDGWSIGVLVRELEVLYQAASGGDVSPLKPLRVQYADFARWQRQWLAGEILEQQIDWWRNHLEGLEDLELPADRARPKQRSDAGGQTVSRLATPWVEALESLGRGQGATLFMTLLAIFQVFLARWTGRSSFAVGSPIAGRQSGDLEGLIGFFVNTLVLRCDLAAGATVDAELRRTRDATLGAFDNQAVPYEKLVEVLDRGRDLSTTPLFQVMFALQDLPFGRRELPGLSFEPLDVETGAAKFDLALFLVPEGENGGYRARWEWSRDLFDGVTVERLAHRFTSLLGDLSESLDRRWEDVSLLSAAERHELVVEWNDTSRAGRPETTLWGLVAAQSSRTPEAIAVVSGDEQLSYGFLARRAMALASKLRGLGVGPEVPVGLGVERSPDLIVSVLGILAAGGVYVPLDPSYPTERLAVMLRDAFGGRRSALMVSGPELHERLRHRVPDLRCVTIPSTPLGAPLSESSCSPENLAYIIYTSGSTGRPKGVALSHRGAVDLVCWARESFPPEIYDRVLASTSISFDVSVYELFVPLSLGGRVILAEDVLALPALACSDEVTLVATVQSAMAELVRGPLPASLRQIHMGGEVLPRTLAQAISRRHPQVEAAWNLYGPSEDTTYSTGTRVRPGTGRVPIGRPVSNTRGYVVDGGLRPRPLGAPGELVFTGAGQARGYFNRPGLTALRFVPDPLTGASGGRVYRSGDQVRHLGDGSLDFLGRLDHQVKIRGFRIELGEIETALLALAPVRAAAVKVVQTPHGGGRLVAYVVPEGTAPVDWSTLEKDLGRRLPSYMVPRKWVSLPELPRHPNDKINRRALPDPEKLAARANRVAPRTPVEKRLVQIWAELLDEEPGVTDNFFELGGHSLNATRVLSTVQQAFGVEIAVRDFFEAPTIADLARRIETDSPQTVPRALRKISPVRRGSGNLDQLMSRVGIPG